MIMRDVTGGVGPHAGQPIAAAGAPPGEAAGALILVHGRGGDAAGMLGLAEAVAPPGTLCLAPQAAGHSWYPHRFTEPVARNEPHLGSGLSVLGDLVDRVGTLGCRPSGSPCWASRRAPALRSSSARRRELRLRAVIGLSGGLIGDAVAPLRREAVRGHAGPARVQRARPAHPARARARDGGGSCARSAPRWSHAFTRAANTASTRMGWASYAISWRGWSERRLGPRKAKLS
jgi:hypothetical protein